ncbi:MAG: tRNA (adenine(22)-N(1))-methyltransferase TrmK [Clostridiales bacterium]|nr:tRNA (adenine(22)-N(1))-methyltransferase TrmK [Candidatus Equinaster intestinalis]
MQEISQRLKKIAGLVPMGANLADIGTDHGYLSVYTVQSGIAKRVIACDINEKPLENARQNISYVKAENIELRLCDGFGGILPDEIDCAVIAGMGAEVIIHIIGSCDWIKSPDYTLILQPMTSPELLRRWLYENGFYIETELAISENRKLYSIMRVKFSGVAEVKEEAFYYVGRLDAGDPVAQKYLLKQYSRFKKCEEQLLGSPENEKLRLFYREISENIKKRIGES